MLAVIFGHQVGDLRLPATVAIIAAANPRSTPRRLGPRRPAGQPADAPVPDRGRGHLDRRDADRVHPARPAERPRPVPRPHRGPSRGEVAAFIRTPRDLLHAFPADAASTGQAWPSPRTWAMTTDVLAVLPRDDDEACLAATGGLVGEGPAVELMTWRRASDLPDPAAVVAGPHAVPWGELDPSQVWAVLTGVVGFCCGQGATVAWRQAWGPLAAAAGGRVRRRGRRECPGPAGAHPGGASVPTAAKAFAAALATAGMGAAA